ncbi:hypothetical protein EJ73_01030 [Hoylesella shahii DSM 15611 = JCM 12083]|uniref:Uncharacterized protein n=1 Tax=Hoylesella shahii DSM 15611 = JCM 12083 TaxID=1122991 RepID=A0A318I5G8_9BACT|nr:hypothetical protein EJ73_01030 [Hoylesella shahii DSM 15611 = JCM 12083]
MKLTHSQISEILSNYKSSSEGLVTLQSLIMNSLMYHEGELNRTVIIWKRRLEEMRTIKKRLYPHG